MTKLKKKKSKKRTKAKYRVEDLMLDASYRDFVESIVSDPETRISKDCYRWGLDSDFLSSNLDLFPDRKKAVSDTDSTVPVRISDLGHDGRYELGAAIRGLQVVIELAQCPALFSAQQFSERLVWALDLVAEEPEELSEENPVVHQILFGELALTIGLQFPQLDSAESLVESARIQLERVIESVLDGDGLPHAKYLEFAPLLLACWTRCQKLCDQSNMECFDLDAQTQFEYFVRQMMRLMRKDGSFVFSDGDVCLKKTVQAALSCYHDDDDANVSAVLFPKRGVGKSAKPSLNSLPESSVNSEWGELAVLQTEWLPKLPKLSVSYLNRKIVAELSCGGVLFNGELKTEICVDNQLVAPNTDWEVVCWHSDQDGDFLELECELENGTKWQKHFLLARNDRFLLVGDIILGAGGKSIDCSTSWPFYEGTGFGVAQETNEIFLTRKAKTVAAILPISMSEWRSQRSESNIAIGDGRLNYQVSSVSNNLYCPLFFDLDAKRCRKPLTWRKLTVAEKLNVLSDSDAVGFRVHVGGQQWMIYRSLEQPASRTVFGQNLSVEFYVGAFESNGMCSEIISVD